MKPAKQIDLRDTILSPMPGSVVSVDVKQDDQVVPGQTLLIL